MSAISDKDRRYIQRISRDGKSSGFDDAKGARKKSTGRSRAKNEKPRVWTNRAGQSLRAKYVRVFNDNVVLLKDAPNRENAIKFMDFLLEPENIAAVSNYARYGNGLSGTAEFLDPELATLPEGNPPADAGPGTFIAVCDEETQAVYDRIWTAVKK